MALYKGSGGRTDPLSYRSISFTSTLCGIPSAIDLQHGTIAAMCKSIQNNNPFNKHIILINNQLSANNIPNAEQQPLQRSDRDIRAARRNRGVVLADPIHPAPTALSISGKQLMD